MLVRLLRYAIFGIERDSVFNRLRRYLAVSNTIVAIGLFGAIFAVKVDLRSYVGDISVEDVIRLDIAEKIPVVSAGLGDLVTQRWPDLFVFLFITVWYFAYRTAATREIELLVTFYADDRPPMNWDRITGGRFVPLLAVGITLTFTLMAASFDRTLLLCAVMQFLLCQDAFGNNTLRRNILAHYFDPDLAPRADDPLRDRLLRRRQVALDYWVWRPHLTRIGLMMCVTALIAALSIAGQIGGHTIADPVLRLVLALAIAINEATMIWWRFRRDDALLAIDDGGAAEALSMPGALRP
jgi:hypothetical protein